MVPDVPESRLSVISASVVGVASLGSLCGCNSDSADCACTVAQLGGAACAASGSSGRTCGTMVGGVVATLIAVAPASQPSGPLAAFAGVCGCAFGRSDRRCGAVVVLLLREVCTDGADIGVALCGAADGLCGPGVVLFVLAWEEAVEELDTVAPAVPVCG